MEQLAKASKTGIILRVHVLAGSSLSSIDGVHAGRLKIKVAAKAVEGAANKALKELLAEYFAVSKTSVTLLKGEHARHKLVSIAGSPESLLKQLRPFLSAD